MTVHLDQGADESTARWLCHGCGAMYDLDGGPAFPICACGQRCVMVDADGLPFVGSPSARLQAALDEHANAYAGWRAHLANLRASLDELHAEALTESDWDPLPSWRHGFIHSCWTFLAGACRYTNDTAAHLDRVEAEVGRLAS